MRPQAGQIVKSAFEFLLGEKRVQMPVAAGAEQQKVGLDGAAVEVLLVPLVVVSALRNEVVPGERRFALAELAGADHGMTNDE